MNTLNWKELINSNKEYIYLFGYGSLLNSQTHHSLQKNLIPVKTKGFKRIFSLSYDENICNDKEYNKRFEKIAIQLHEDFNINKNQLSFIDNSGSLSVSKSNDKDIYLNGLLLKIERKDFLSYSIREKSYNLQKINVEYYNKKDILNNNEIFILVNNKIKIKSNIYYLYQKVCRIGAYNQSVDFGIDYDETTYSYNNELAYKELNHNIFKIGNHFKISNNLLTINKYPGLKEELIKNYNEECIILKNHKYLVEVLILSTGIKIWLDNADLSLI